MKAPVHVCVAVYTSEFKTYIAFKANRKLKRAYVNLLYYHAEELQLNIALSFNMNNNEAHTWTGSQVFETTLFSQSVPVF